MIQMDVFHSGIDADEKSIIHDKIRVGQIAVYSTVDIRIGGMAQQISAKKIPRLDEVRLQKRSQIGPGKACVFPNGQDKTKPGWSAMGCPFRQNKPLLERHHNLRQLVEVFPAFFDKSAQFRKLGTADGGLHFSGLKIITDMAVNILMVITYRQCPELLDKPLAAGIITAASTLAISAPVAQGTGDPRQIIIACRNGSTFAESDMVRGIKGERGQMSECSRQTPFVGGTQCVTIILD